MVKIIPLGGLGEIGLLDLHHDVRIGRAKALRQNPCVDEVGNRRATRQDALVEPAHDQQVEEDRQHPGGDAGGGEVEQHRLGLEHPHEDPAPVLGQPGASGEGFIQLLAAGVVVRVELAQGKRVLNLFAYTGSFSVAALSICISLLLAVINRRAGIDVIDQDVFVNVVGGVRIGETAADLPTLLAASDFIVPSEAGRRSA